jgi:redox-sensitive bicupin YhaK (pirin superfamily)
VHTLQLWVNLPAERKLTEPTYRDLRGTQAPTRRDDGTEIRDFTHEDLTMRELRLRPHASTRQPLPPGSTAFVYVLDGEGVLGGPEGHAVWKGQVAWLEPPPAETVETTLTVTATGRALRALLFAGSPLREPVVAKGPFVMNTDDEIAEAFADFRAGRFG